MALAIEERELQKMAALTRQDSHTDALRVQVEQLQQVRHDVINTLHRYKVCPFFS